MNNSSMCGTPMYVHATLMIIGTIMKYATEQITHVIPTVKNVNVAPTIHVTIQVTVSSTRILATNLMIVYAEVRETIVLVTAIGVKTTYRPETMDLVLWQLLLVWEHAYVKR